MRFGIVAGLMGVALLAGCEGEKGAAGVPCDDACVTSESIADAAVLGNHLAAGAVGSAALADGSVTEAKLATGAVGAAAIQDGAVGAAAIAPQSIVSALLADLAVTTDKIADGAVDALKIAAGAVETTHLADSAVATAKLDDLAVTSGKIADGAVGTTQLENGGVGGADLDPALVGNGLSLSTNVLSANTSVLQARVGACPGGTVLRSVDATGTPTCVALQDPRFTTGNIPAGSGNSGTGITCEISEVRLFPGNYAPKGTFVADGRLLPIIDHQALFSILGTTYGGDGINDFAIPDLRDQAPDGVSYVICASGTFPPLP